jgi:predicted oxidoreductase
MKINEGVREKRVDATPNGGVGSRRKLAAQIEQVKNDFPIELRDALETPDKIIRLALNEAVALAWETEYPHLLFPVLATEKIQAVREWNARQILLRQNKFVQPMSN